ncbi:WD40 repeat domain-containing protein [Pseudochelatococcus contaminans]|uniref:WD40 repeat protein n=1 Tax=Pseudochelatococcus contaminans TaxID=1538103 RepID=A0A7W6EG99_9HYPH|nr:WD40 repeat domain-containing protein [Pseudochelatococcus contaminans]MBB3809316.1 WD40 repeat protein [Pseudochelatococcus contaminans]
MTVDSLLDRVASFDVGAHVTGLGWLGDVAAFALGDGGVILLDPSGDRRRVEAHPDAGALVAAISGERLITGGDDGRIVSTDANGNVETLVDEKGRWIVALAARPDGALAWSLGKDVKARDNRGQETSFSVGSTAQGLAFAPKGYRLAISHYNGATLWYPAVEKGVETLQWKGAHLDVTFSPDNLYVVTSMQENTLHGWRLKDGKDMRMAGYPAKTRSFAWSHDGDWLATSGADAAIVWPFAKDGPMGKAPRECGVRSAVVTRVAFHPGALVLAAGYADGAILMIRLTDAAELLVRSPDTSVVSALAWDAKGSKLAFGTDNGNAGILTLP